MAQLQSPRPVLRFVHLSDIHFGQPGSDAIATNVQERLVRDCAFVQDEIVSGPATALLVAGDVAYGGKESEYERAGAWMDEVATAAGCNPRSIRLIPGNHDVDWTKLDPAGQAHLEQLRRSASDVCGDELHAALRAGNSPLLTPLEDYFSFAAAYGCSFDDPEKPYHDITYPLGDQRITVRGLCSVYVSNRADSPGSMILSTPQYASLNGDDGELVVMVHHPLDWFKNKQEAGNYIKARSKLLLTGHEHLLDFVLKIWNGDFQQVHVAAGAVNPPAATSIHQFAYNWIELSTQSTKMGPSLVVRIIPRVWNFSRAEFDADYQRTGKKPDWTIKLPLTARRSSKTQGDKEVAAYGSPPRPINFDDPISIIRFTFWRHRTREQRIRILQDLRHLGPTYNNTTFPFLQVHQAFEDALKKDKVALKKALGPPSKAPKVNYQRAAPEEIAQELDRIRNRGQRPLDQQSLQLLSDATVRSGYYRTNQVLTVALRDDEVGRYIELAFSADLIPKRGTAATVSAPEVIAPQNTSIRDDGYTYTVDEHPLKMFETYQIFEAARDQLTIRYALQDDTVSVLNDNHVWASPVADFVIRFRLQEGCNFEATAEGAQPLHRSKKGQFEEFFSRSVSRTGDQIFWKLSLTHR